MEKKEVEHVIAPFFGLHPKDTREELVKRLLPMKKRGFYKVTVEYSAGSKTLEQARFDETFFKAAEELCEALKELGMTFWLQDAAPFPSGNANGALEHPENLKKGKRYIEERHVDVTGPRKNAIVRVDNLLHMVYGGNLKDPAELAKLGTRELLAVTACRLNAGHKIVDGSFIRLDGYVKNGFLEWDVPKGHWRIFVLYTTFENHGRKNFINLLSEESVALQVEQVHMPVYEHLKDHLGKEWNGFFYDEPEIGNTEEGCYDNFNILPGRRQKVANDMISMPWSPEMPHEMEKRDRGWVRVEELKHSGRTIWFLHNEAPSDGIGLELSVRAGGKALVVWNPLTMECEEICEAGKRAERTCVSLGLEQFELKILSEMQDYMEMLKLYQKAGENLTETCFDGKITYQSGWYNNRKAAGMADVEIAENRMILENTGWKIQVDNTQKAFSCDYLTDLGAEDFLGRDFSGCIRYEKRFHWNGQKREQQERHILNLGSVYETAEVWINGKYAGFRFTPPYRFDITEALKTGENVLEITVYNNTVNRKGGGFMGLSYENFNASPVFIMEPSGLLGSVTVSDIRSYF